MSIAPADRSQLASDAERALRRGDLKEAVLLYRRILERDPGDAAARARLATIESLLQPSELAGRSAPTPAPVAVGAERSATPEQLAEGMFENGDYPGALQAYQQILSARPSHQLARERLQELSELVRVTTPQPAKPRPLPDRESVLASLLARVGERRKG